MNRKQEAISISTKVATKDSTNSNAFRQVINTIPHTKQSSKSTVKNPKSIETTITNSSKPKNTKSIKPDRCLQATNSNSRRKQNDKQFLNS